MSTNYYIEKILLVCMYDMILYIHTHIYRTLKNKKCYTQNKRTEILPFPHHT